MHKLGRVPIDGIIIVHLHHFKKFASLGLCASSHPDIFRDLACRVVAEGAGKFP